MDEEEIVASFYFNRFKFHWEITRCRELSRRPYTVMELDRLFDFYFDRFGNDVIQTWTINTPKRRLYKWRENYVINGGG